MRFRIEDKRELKFAALDDCAFHWQLMARSMCVSKAQFQCVNSFAQCFDVSRIIASPISAITDKRDNIFSGSC